jgi:SAM-dependent methyltransferase
MATPTYELTACPACGTTAACEIASIDAGREELEALWGFHGRRLRPETPPVHLADRVAFSQRPPLRLAACARCGHLFRNPIERTESLRAAYAGAAPPREVLASLHATQLGAARAQLRRLERVVGRAGSGLEVGSYVGAFLAAACERGWRFAGIDLDADASAFARSLGLVVHEGTLEAHDAGARVDAVAIWNCFDQLPDPRATLRAAALRLAPGGVVAIRVPNGAFYASLRRRLASRVPGVAAAARALLAHNNLLGFPYRHGFTPRSLARLAEREGLHVERIVGDTLVPIADEWTRRWAHVEERAVKAALRVVARATRGRVAPWFELYARREGRGM